MAIWIPADVPAGREYALAYVIHVKAVEKDAAIFMRTPAAKEGAALRRAWLNRKTVTDIQSTAYKFGDWIRHHPREFKRLIAASGGTEYLWIRRIPQALGLIAGWRGG